MEVKPELLYWFIEKGQNTVSVNLDVRESYIRLKKTVGIAYCLIGGLVFKNEFRIVN
jgi:hypothetical protein